MNSGLKRPLQNEAESTLRNSEIGVKSNFIFKQIFVRIMRVLEVLNNLRPVVLDGGNFSSTLSDNYTSQLDGRISKTTDA